jgi:hypothetical protein
MSETLESLMPTEDVAIRFPRSSAFSTTSSFNPVDLDPSLILAAERGFVIAPALTLSRFASARSYVRVPMGGIDIGRAARGLGVLKGGESEKPECPCGS